MQLVLLLVCAASVHASDRALKVSIRPVKAPLTRPFDPSLALASPDIEPTDSRVAKAAPGCDAPEQVWQQHCRLLSGTVHPSLHKAPLQTAAWSPSAAVLHHRLAVLLAPLSCLVQVHLTCWSSTSVLVSWASCDAAVEQQPGAPAPARASTAGVSSIVQYGTSRDALQQTAEGVATSYVSDYSSVGGVSYASPLLHHVLLKGEGGRVAVCWGVLDGLQHLPQPVSH